MLEVRLARHVLGEGVPPVETVFFGGGTPTLLPAGHLGSILREIDELFGLAPGAEVTTEANPESVTPAYLERLREAGFTRISFGMQSAAPHVLRLLDRQHTPGRAVEVVGEARRAGFRHVNLDLIYGTPGESEADWQASLDRPIAAGPDHVSAYALVVEEGTAMSRKVRRGELPEPDDDVLADRYVQADETLSRSGFGWYEVSNWARGTAARSRHNRLLLDRRRLVGRRSGRAQPRRRSAVVERATPCAVHGQAARGGEPGGGARAARSGGAPDGGHDARPAAARRAAGPGAVDAGAGGGRLRRSATGCWTGTRTSDGRAVLTLRGRLLADAVARDLTD